MLCGRLTDWMICLMLQGCYHSLQWKKPQKAQRDPAQCHNKRHIIHIIMKNKEKGKFLPTTCNEGTEGEQRYSSTLSLTSALDEGGWSMQCPCHFILGKRPGTHFTWGTVVLGVSLDSSENLAPTRVQTPNCLACSDSLYWLHYQFLKYLSKL
jgi:hypothetical protein